MLADTVNKGFGVPQTHARTMAHAGRMVAHTHVAAQHDTMGLIVSTEMPARTIPAKMVAHAAALVTHTHVTAQQDTMALVVSTGMPAYPILA